MLHGTQANLEGEILRNIEAASRAYVRRLTPAEEAKYKIYDPLRRKFWLPDDYHRGWIEPLKKRRPVTPHDFKMIR